MDDLLADFLTETNESLTELDVALVRLERSPNDGETLALIFRLVHTIKGTCGFLGLPRLERVAHAAENVLGRVRNGELQVTPDIVTTIRAALDRIKDIVQGLAVTGAEAAGVIADPFADGDGVGLGDLDAASDRYLRETADARDARARGTRARHVVEQVVQKLDRRRRRIGRFTEFLQSPQLAIGVPEQALHRDAAVDSALAQRLEHRPRHPPELEERLCRRVHLELAGDLVEFREVALHALPADPPEQRHLEAGSKLAREIGRREAGLVRMRRTGGLVGAQV
jgi:chemotaxis protein histidine kinase CheA